MPPGVPAGTLAHQGKNLIARSGSQHSRFEQETVPLPPTAGVEQVHPAGAESETKVMIPGNVSSRETVVASSGPPLVTVIV